MPRNFGLRRHIDDFWNGSPQGDADGWVYVVIGAAVVVVIAVSMLVG